MTAAMDLPAGNDNLTRFAYIFLDESGNFDFGNSGTRYLVLTSVGIFRPSPMWGRIADYKYRCIETGTDIEYFHCYDDRGPVRGAVFDLIADHLDNMRIAAWCATTRGPPPRCGKTSAYTRGCWVTC